MSIRIMIVEDHFIAREGLKSLIAGQADMQVVAEASDGAQVPELYRSARPDVVLMDLRLPQVDGAEATRRLLREDAGAKVLILSSYDTDQDVGRAHDAGARGYALKEAEGRELLHAIRTVHAGERYTPAIVAQRLEARDRNRLTVREMQLLDHIHGGSTNREIAHSLGLTEGTVRVYLTALLAKLQARNRTEAVARAIAAGYLKPPR